jgi:hypothetical protein
VTFQARILGAEASTASGLGGEAKMPGLGMTGIVLRYHKHKKNCETPEGTE